MTEANLYIVDSTGAYPITAGYYYLAWLEKGGDGTCVFVGDNASDDQQCGLYATIWAQLRKGQHTEYAL
jgi:hypothetical protein